MENNLENKSKFFGQYWGQKVFINALNCPYFIQKVGSSYMTKYGIENRCLYLKPLSSITDEDAGHVHYGATSEEFKHYYRNDFGLAILNQTLQDIDYLRSKGYALPYMGLSVETMVEWGWIKLENEN